MKWYNVEIPAKTKEQMERLENFKWWLYCNHYQYETSGCFEMVHFEIFASENDLIIINNALDEIVWFDAITEK